VPAPSFIDSIEKKRNFETSESNKMGRITWESTKSFLLQHHMPIGLALLLFFAYFVPAPGIYLGQTPVNTISIFVVFLISGLNLRTEEIKRAITSYKSYIFGLLSILVLSPLLSFGIVLIPFGPIEFAQGLAIFVTMPTTVSTGVLMTGEANGNVALAVLLSTVTNLLAVFSVPFFVSGFMKESNIMDSFDPVSLLAKLLLLILLPLGIGKLLQQVSYVAQFSKKYKFHLKILSSLMLILVPYVNFSQAVDQLHSTSSLDILKLVAAGILLHVVLLIFNYVSCILLRIKLPETKAVVINASQKTINTAMVVIQYLPDIAGNKGLFTIPCVIGHFSQTIIDAFVSSYWKSVNEPGHVDDAPTPSTPSTSQISNESQPSGDARREEPLLPILTPGQAAEVETSNIAAVPQPSEPSGADARTVDAHTDLESNYKAVNI
jgi:solute carrier family 10 (sodium/bile acid cotransporter), member 7